LGVDPSRLGVDPSRLGEQVGVDPSSLNGKVMFGYQGWFGANGDGLPGYGFRHWSLDGNTPRPGSLAFDSYPDFSEYPSQCLYTTDLVYADGKNASVFSPYCPGVVDLHFKWLQNYNLDGVFLQRFVTEIQSPGVTLTQRDKVSGYVRDAAEKYGRVFGIMYDISGANSATLLQTLQNDWKHLINDLKLTSSGQYIHQDNKPVLVIWGIGFTDHPPDTTDEAIAIINYFKTQANVYLVGGVPYYWQASNQDSKPGYLPVYSQFDALSPWAVGRYGDNNTFDSKYTSVVVPDKQYTDSKKIGYAPVIFPGFSWSNLMKNPAIRNQIPRAGGGFFLHQSEKHLQLKPSWIYLAMFDEVNEGTALFKVVSQKSQTPTNAEFTYQSIDGITLPSDAYLTFASQLTSQFHALSE